MSSIDVESLPACTECGRRVRRCAVPVADAPGTVAYGARGMCSSCYRRRHQPRPPLRGDGTLDTDALPTCTECGKPMRPHGTSLAAWPGTILTSRADEHRCTTCHRKAERDARENALLEAVARQARQRHAAAARVRARNERDRLRRLSAVTVGGEDQVTVREDARGRLDLTMTRRLGAYDGSTTAHHQVVASALRAFAGVLARRCLRPVTSPAPVIDRARGEVTVSAKVAPTACARQVAR